MAPTVHVLGLGIAAWRPWFLALADLEFADLVSDSATFRAAFPSIQTALKIHGDGNGMRIQLDIPESEMAEAVKLLAWRQRVLVVTVRPEDGESRGKHRKIHL